MNESLILYKDCFCPMDKSLVHEFWEWVSNSPDAVALFDQKRPIAYQSLGVIANSIKLSFQDLEILPRSRVLIIGARNVKLYASLIAGWTASLGTCVLNEDVSLSHINRVIGLIRPSVIIDLRDSDTREDIVESLSERQAIVNSEFGNVYIFALRDFKVLETIEAYIVMTSGSTGIPKFISILQSSVRQFLDVNKKMRPVLPSDIATQIFPSSFDLFYYDVLTTLNSGAALVIIKEQYIWQALNIASHLNVTLWFSVPSVARLIQRTRAWEENLVPPFRQILFCGEPLPKKLLMSWAMRFPLANIENLYGPAEVTMACASYAFTSVNEKIDNEIVPIGNLFPGLQAVLLDQHNNFADIGTGELCISGPQVMSGYLDVLDENASKGAFVSYGDRRFYKTGDIVHRDADGQMQFIGRCNRQFKYSGIRIEPEGIERVVLQIPEIFEVAIVPQYARDRVSTQGFTLYYSMELDNRTESPLEKSVELKIIQCIQEEFSSLYVPKNIIFIKEIPHKSNGKIDYNSLIELGKDAAILDHSINSDDTHVLAKEIIAKSLNLNIKNILDTDRIHEHYQWDSLGHLKIVAALEKRLGHHVDPQDCFSVTSITQLLRKRKDRNDEPIVQTGLHGVWMARTSICEINSSAKYLCYRGLDISTLIQEQNFSSVAFLLNVGKLPNLDELEDARNSLLEGYCNQGLPTDIELTQAKLCIALLSASNDCDEFFKKNPQTAAFWVIGRLLATVGASSESVANGVASALLSLTDHSLTDHSLTSQEYRDTCLTAMDQVLIILSEHGSCASTTTLRCVTSTEASPTHAIVAAMSAFSGARHGGAIAQAGKALATKVWEHEELWKYDMEQPPSGFGHRVYMDTDPRCTLLSAVFKKLPGSAKAEEELQYFIDFVREKESKLYPNVDLLAAAILGHMGFSPELMKIIFSIARVAGWTAHYFEQSRNNILIRPRLLFDANYDQRSHKIAEI